jgi:hypothetical protein
VVVELGQWRPKINWESQILKWNSYDRPRSKQGKPREGNNIFGWTGDRVSNLQWSDFLTTESPKLFTKCRPSEVKTISQMAHIHNAAAAYDNYDEDDDNITELHCNIWRREDLRDMKLLIMQPPPASRQFLPLRYKSHHPVHKHPLRSYLRVRDRQTKVQYHIKEQVKLQFLYFNLGPNII